MHDGYVFQYSMACYCMVAKFFGGVEQIPTSLATVLKSCKFRRIITLNSEQEQQELPKLIIKVL